MRTNRLTALLLAAALCLGMTACGDKSDSAGGKDNAGENAGVTGLVQELGYGYLSEYAPLEGMELSYVNSSSAAQGKLYVFGEYYNEETYEGGSRLYARDMITGAVEEIPLPELPNGENNTYEYVQSLSVCPDGSGYWMISNRYTYNADEWEDDPVVTDDAEAEAAPEAGNHIVLPAEDTPEAGDDIALPAEDTPDANDDMALPAEDTPDANDPIAVSPAAFSGNDYRLDLLTDTVPVEETEASDSEEEAVADEAPESENVYESNDSYLARKCGMDGGVLVELDLSQATADMDYFYCEAMAQDGQGNLYIACDESILRFGPDGTQRDSLTGDLGYVNSMVAAGDGTVVVSAWNDQGGMGLYRLEDGGLSPIDSEAVNITGRNSLYPGDGASVLLDDGTLLWSVDTATGQSQKLLSWIDSDINGSNVNAVLADGQDKVLVLLEEYRRGAGGMTYELGVLTRTPAAEIPVRTILSLGAQYLSSDVQEALIRFNRESDAYRITLTDYSKYNSEEDWMAGAKQMERDIISGACPDILYLSSGNADKYISKGALYDLRSLIDGDESFSLDSLVEGPLKAYTRDEKLYAMPYRFALQTAYASAKLVGDKDRWTLSEMKQIVDGLDEDVDVMDGYLRSDFLTVMVYYNLSRFVDYATATCDFDNEDFKSLLEMAAKLPEDYDYDDVDGEDVVYATAFDYEDSNAKLQRGALLMTSAYISESYELRNMYGLYTGDNGFVRIGYPTDGGNGALLNVDSAMAVSARCAAPEGAWAFIKTLLSDEVQENMWSLPMTRTAFDKVLAEAMEKESYTDENGEKVYIDSTSYIGGTEYSVEPMTQAQADDFRAYVAGAGIAGSYDTDIMEILEDESAAYFAGDKSADEVAKLIQNRVGIYLGETS